MMPSPALSWMCLLPNNVRLECANAPRWVTEALESVERNDGCDQMLVTGKSLPGKQQQLDRFGGLVTFNAKMPDAQLKEAGFKCIRRFAVLPSWKQPRWFMPLDTAAVSSAAFELYQPFRRAARIKHRLAKSVAGWGLPVWYRDHLLIAHREPLPFEATLQHIIGSTAPVRLAISSGSVAAAEGRKLTLAMLDLQGNILAYAKRSLSPESRRRVEREGELLEVLNQRHNLNAPKLLHRGDFGDAALVVSKPLVGAAPGKSLTPEHERFLAGLRTSRKLASETELVQSLGRRVQSLHNTELVEVLSAAIAVLESAPLPCGIVHRDFAPWNLRIQSGELAALDWESAALDGPPLLDETHHELAVQYFVQRSTPEAALRKLEASASCSPLGLTKPQVQALQVVYLVDHVTQLTEEGYSLDYPKLVWWRRVLDQLAPWVLHEAARTWSVAPDERLRVEEAAT